jgi:hypothetical protein
MLIANSVVRIGLAMLAAGLTSCGSNSPKANGPQSTPSATKVPPATVLAEPPGGYDIGRIANLATQLPPGFTVTQIPRTTLTKEQADSIAGLSKQFAFTFDPAHCNTVLKPAGVDAGSVSQGLVAHGPQEVTVVAAQSPQAIPDTVVGAGCSHVTFKSQDTAQGTADRLPGPAIDGASTSAVKVHLDFATPTFSKSIDRLTFFAALSDKTAVVVDGESNPQLLADLLVKAVAAIRQR